MNEFGYSNIGDNASHDDINKEILVKIISSLEEREHIKL